MTEIKKENRTSEATVLKQATGSNGLTSFYGKIYLTKPSNNHVVLFVAFKERNHFPVKP